MDHSSSITINKIRFSSYFDEKKRSDGVGASDALLKKLLLDDEQEHFAVNKI